MEPQGTQRRLAAILASDMVGYSRLIEADEEGTLARQKAHRKVLIDPTIAAYHGRIVKSTGDGLLVEFPSVVDAFRCAVSVQLAMLEREAQIPEVQRITYRIGINLGDIVIDDDDIYGDGVNIAARLEGLAEPGGICVSRTVFDQIKGKVNSEFESIGAQRVKNIAEPIQVYRVKMKPEAAAAEYAEPALKRTPWRWAAVAAVVAGIVAVGGVVYWSSEPPESRPGSVEHASATRPDKPSIAVLPFANMSDDAEQEYFSDGISEDIITDLSRLANIDVIARNSSFTYKGIAIKVQEIGKDLNVQYVLEGSVRKAGNRLRITAQLIDTRSGHHLWAERYDRELTDIFALQDEITKHIVTKLSIQLSEEEKRALGQVATNSFEAYDLFLKGQRAFAQLTKEGLNHAVELYQQAITLDPGFARAYGGLAVTLVRRVGLGHTDSPDVDKGHALTLAQKAVSIDPASPHALWALGFVLQSQNRLDEAVEALELAISIAPSFADGYGLLALIKNKLADSEEAIRLIEKGMVMNPYYTWDYLYNLGRAYYALGDYSKAGQYLEQAIERNEAAALPRLFLIANYVRLGQQDDAEWAVTEINMLESNSSLSHLRRGTIVVDEALRKRFFEDLRTAGLPE